MKAWPNFPGVTFHDLYETYPDLDIDVQHEQDLLLRHDTIVFQFPFFWYSTPAILKEWMDLVLAHGFAYGSEGKALEGKTLFCAITTGGQEDAYQKGGYNRFTMRELLVPIEQTAWLCNMHYLPPFVIHGTLTISPQRIRDYAKDYRNLLQAVCRDQIQFEVCKNATYLNRFVPELKANAPEDDSHAR